MAHKFAKKYPLLSIVVMCLMQLFFIGGIVLTFFGRNGIKDKNTEHKYHPATCLPTSAVQTESTTRCGSYSVCNTYYRPYQVVNVTNSTNGPLDTVGLYYDTTPNFRYTNQFTAIHSFPYQQIGVAIPCIFDISIPRAALHPSDKYKSEIMMLAWGVSFLCLFGIFIFCVCGWALGVIVKDSFSSD